MSDDNLNWLETRGRFDRYALIATPEESIWLCGECGEEGDPDAGTCPCHEEEDEDELEEEEECA